jgi:hypothetical protein
MGKKKTNTNTNVINQASTAYNQSRQPSQLENELAPVSQTMYGHYNDAVGQNKQDYGNIMGGYQDLFRNTNITAPRPGELNESYGYLREAMPGYREFAATGGYSDKDQQELRARGIAPIRSAYGNTMMEMDRARSLGGAGGAPNYIAAASRAQRELPGQMADAMTNVNAGLAESIREGKKFGLSGISSTGSTMGGLASDEAGRQLQAQGMTLQGKLGALGGMNSLYGTTPGLSSMFGNQALNAYGQRAGLEGQRQNYGLGLLETQMRAQQQEQQKTPWWKTALGVAGTIAPYAAMMFPPTAGLGAIGAAAKGGR